MEGCCREAVPSARSVGERVLDRGARVQSAQHDDRGDGVASELRRDVRRDGGKAQNVNVQLFSGVTCRLEMFAAVVPQSEIQARSRDGPLDHLGVAVELVADRGANEIRAV